ncbi:dihydrofolate reductase [Kocuria sp.]|uniref:dihydrofolate reductase n=1 Tax=Kocuria sp. TaxID=1871328 RepID=UPI0026E04A89|nr:dihydrofolate reductase [Kocuria sp.]MDO5617430.1 dihydrofolate reductase [Kocuria sp.]
MSGAPPVIGAIWAQTRDGVIGAGGSMPWHVPEDFAHFKSVTTGHPVIMGRRTWESFPAKFKPLPDRTNIVMTSRPQEFGDAEGAVVVDSYADAVAAARAAEGGEEIWVIGGGQLYGHALTSPQHPVTHCVVSVLDLQIDGDTHAPQLDATWQLVAEEDRGTSRTGVPWRVQTWQRHPMA